MMCMSQRWVVHGAAGPIRQSRLLAHFDTGQTVDREIVQREQLVDNKISKQQQIEDDDEHGV